MTTITALQPGTGHSARTVEEALSKLPSGVFRAIVLQQSGNRVLLDTAFGKFQGQISTKLSPGDEIQARLTTSKNDGVLQVLQVRNAPTAIRSQELFQIVEKTPARAMVAQVVKHQSGQTLLQTGRELVAIKRQPALNTGDRILLKPTAQGTLLLERLNIQEILRQSLYTLSARDRQADRTYNLSSLHRFVGDLDQQRIESLVTRANRKASELSAQVSTDTRQPAGQPANPVQTGARDLDPLLRDLLNIRPPALNSQGPSINPQGLRELLLLAIGHQQTAGTSPPLARTLSELFNVLKQSPESMRQLIERMLGNLQASQAKPLHSDSALENWSNLLRIELMQQSEQTLNQLLTQQTGGRLQVEQNQPLQIQLNLPLIVEQNSRDLKLSLTQRKPREDEDYQDGWDIQLAFEFGLLGLISTRIALRDRRISADFWAELEPTRTLLEQNFDLFREQLIRQGFEPGDLVALSGKPPDTPSSAADLLPENLLDVQA